MRHNPNPNRNPNQAIELRDTLVPGFLCKITPTGRKVFMSSIGRTPASDISRPWACLAN